MNIKILIGRPEFTPDKFTGYILWKQSDGFHLRWTVKGKKQHTFQGKIVCSDKVKVIKVQKTENAYKVNETQKNTIEWDTLLDTGVDGFDFLTPGDFEVELRIKRKKVKTKEIFLGSEMVQADNNPFKILQPASELILGEEIVKDEMEVEKSKPITEIKLKEPEPVYETESKIESKVMVEPKVEIINVENMPFEPAPLPIPASEYETIPETVPTIESQKAPIENSEKVITSPTETESIAIKEPVVSIKKVEIEPEKRIYDWLAQLLTYRDFAPKIDVKAVSSYNSLPDTKPEKLVDSSSKVEDQVESTLELENFEHPELGPLSETVSKSESKIADEMETRIYAWLTQLQKFRKFNIL